VKDLILLLPEIFLVVTLAGVVIGEIGHKDEKTRLAPATALAGLVGALVQTLILYGLGPAEAFSGAVSVDGFALFFKLYAITLAALSILMPGGGREMSPSKRAEHCALVLGAALAVCLVAAASDIILIFLSMQLLFVVGCFLTAHGRRNRSGAEASVKYLVFGVASAFLFLFGAAILFAYTHVFNIYDMHKVLLANPMPAPVAAVAFVMIFFALAFHIVAFPMSLVAPDVLEGAPTPVGAGLSLGARAAGFALAIRMIVVVFAQPSLSKGQWAGMAGFDWIGILAIISGLTMVAGSLLALVQTSAKRLVSYIVVAQTGFLLMGLLVLDEVGISALLFNLVVDLFALSGAYFVISTMYDELGSDRLAGLGGMLHKYPAESISLILFLACAAGLPPLPGFMGKFALTGAAVRHGWYALAVVAIISSALGAVAMGRLSFSLIGRFGQGDGGERPNIQRVAFLASLIIPMIMIGIFAERVLDWAGKSLQFARW